MLLCVLLSGCKKDQEVTADPPEPREDTNETEPEIENPGLPLEQKPPKDNEPPVITENRITITLDSDIQATTHPDGSDLSQRSSHSILLSTKKEHQLLIHFLQEMNKQQVETLIQSNFQNPLQFNWSGTDLHITIPPFSDDVSYIGHHVSLDGAQTANGEILQDQSYFGLTFQPPQQLRRIASDGSGTIDTDTNFTTLYPVISPLTSERYWLLFNWTRYCECDAGYSTRNYLYDKKTKTTHYLGITNTPLTTYRGEGAFWIDTRGFFLEENAVEEADISFQKLYTPNGFVQDAAFLKDGLHVVLAIGEDAEDIHQDLVILNLNTMEEKVSADLIPGFFYNELNGAQDPIPFYDDDEFIYFHVSRTDNQPKGGYYLFEKETGKVMTFESNSGFHTPKYSYDKQYMAIPGDGIYKDNKKIYDLNKWEFYWSPIENRLLVRGYDGNLGEIISMEGFEKQPIDIPDHYSLKGWSEDGKWIYYFGP